MLSILGMIEAIRISRAAYPYHLLHKEFNDRFMKLRPKLTKLVIKEGCTDRKLCTTILNDIWPDSRVLTLPVVLPSSKKGLLNTKMNFGTSGTNSLSNKGAKSPSTYGSSKNHIYGTSASSKRTTGISNQAGESASKKTTAKAYEIGKTRVGIQFIYILWLYIYSL